MTVANLSQLTKITVIENGVTTVVSKAWGPGGELLFPQVPTTNFSVAEGLTTETSITVEIYNDDTPTALTYSVTLNGVTKQGTVTAWLTELEFTGLSGGTSYFASYTVSRLGYAPVSGGRSTNTVNLPDITWMDVVQSGETGTTIEIDVINNSPSSTVNTWVTIYGVTKSCSTPGYDWSTLTFTGLSTNTSYFASYTHVTSGYSDTSGTITAATAAPLTKPTLSGVNSSSSYLAVRIYNNDDIPVDAWVSISSSGYTTPNTLAKAGIAVGGYDTHGFYGLSASRYYYISAQMRRPGYTSSTIARVYLRTDSDIVIPPK